jgi:hypothetical protein
MGYFDNFDNELLKKYERKNLKLEKKIIDMFFYLWIDRVSKFMQFYYSLIVYKRPSRFHTICNGSNLTVFDGLLNDNEIT